uniref:Uncharacterized protein n=1 Tax=Astyanax mexicanus TaxID=7994 RepID=A0A3B1IT02_ASTMX
MNAGALLQPASGGNLSRLSNLPFWERRWKDGPEKTYETTSQKSFRPLPSITKTAAVTKPLPAQVVHRDLQHIKEYESESAKAFSSHNPVPITRVPGWTKYGTNWTMHSDDRCTNFHSTQSESFQSLNTASSTHRAVPPVDSVQLSYAQYKLPDSTQKETYIPQTVSPIIRAKEHTSQFPVHVNGANIRTKSNVQFGRPEMAGIFYSTTNLENYLQKQLTPVQRHHCPPSQILQYEGETERANVYLIKDSHIRLPQNGIYFTTTHKEAFEPKPISKTSLDNPPLQNISHMPFGPGQHAAK